MDLGQAAISRSVRYLSNNFLRHRVLPSVKFQNSFLSILFHISLCAKAWLKEWQLWMTKCIHLFYMPGKETCKKHTYPRLLSLGSLWLDCEGRYLRVLHGSYHSSEVTTATAYWDSPLGYVMRRHSAIWPAHHQQLSLEQLFLISLGKSWCVGWKCFKMCLVFWNCIPQTNFFFMTSHVRITQ